jgi:hypothetical protein
LASRLAIRGNQSPAIFEHRVYRFLSLLRSRVTLTSPPCACNMRMPAMQNTHCGKSMNLRTLP